LIYRSTVCKIRSDGKGVDASECCKNLQKLSLALYQTSQNALMDLKKQRCITGEAVRDLAALSSCSNCGNKTPFCNSNPDSCAGHKWRGADPAKMKEVELLPTAPANQELVEKARRIINQLEEALQEGRQAEEEPFERNYMDMVTDLYAALDTDTMMPIEEKQTVIRDLQRIETILWKYSA